MIGFVMLDVAGLSLDAEDIELLSNPKVGGLILFARNFSSTDQLAQLTDSIKAVSPTIIIAVDHEGGRVQRFHEGFSTVPAMRNLGLLYAKNQHQALTTAEHIGWLIGAELLSYKIDISFTPVLDIDHDISQVIGDRAFSSQPQVIVDVANALIRGMHNAGMAATGKHFPGHGGVGIDSHIGIPRDSRSLMELESSDLIPFKLLTNSLDAVMPAHVIYSEIDENPAGFSRFWLTEILRNKLGFKGAILSDDLSMEGASIGGSYIQRAELALSAGCDMVLACNNRKGAIGIVDNVDFNSTESSMRLNKLRGAKNYCRNNLHLTPSWQKAHKALSLIK